MRLPPAHYAVRLFGSYYRLARAISVNPGTVARWTRPKDVANGTAGDIPTIRWCRKVLDAARERGLDLTADDLINGREVIDQFSV